MKKSAIISSQLILWVIFTLMVIAQSKLFLEAKPDAPFGSHFTYVVFLEVVMGMIFFYLTWFTFPWAGKKPVNAFITGAILLLLLLVFAFLERQQHQYLLIFCHSLIWLIPKFQVLQLQPQQVVVSLQMP